LSGDDRFSELGRPGNIWAVSAIHGEIDRLMAMHDALLERVRPGDRVIYLGNYGGPGGSVAEVIDELLAFRRYLISQPGMLPDDVIYLRGSQEEIWQKLLQIQFAPNPRDVFAWMMKNGVDAMLKSYGSNGVEGQAATRDGAPTMTRWTNRLRTAMRQRPGHERFMTVLRRAAYTTPDDDGAVLFVHSGLNPGRPLAAQKDSFWWDHAGFERLETTYEGFTRIVRGCDPAGGGVVLDKIAVTLDGRAGFGGHLVTGRLKPTGEIVELIEV
jgi:hypothetical protein